MGVRGLTGWVKWAAPTATRSPNWSEWAGKRIGVDILGFLYKAKAQRRSPFLFVAQFIAACNAYNIIPVAIFDGKPPDEKREAMKQRSAARVASSAKKAILEEDLKTVPMSTDQRAVIEARLRTLSLTATFLTGEERDLVKQLFYACGVLSLNASGEADNVLAYFARRGELDAIISNDLDFLARGVATLLVPESYALPGDSSGWTQYDLATILDISELSYNQFVAVCVLMGCDYTVGHTMLQYKTAYWAIKYRGEMGLTLKRLGITDYAPYTRAVRLLSGIEDTAESLMGEKQWEKWAAGAPPVEPDILVEFQKALFPSVSPATLLPGCSAWLPGVALDAW